MLTGLKQRFNRFAAGEYCLFSKNKVPGHLAGVLRAEQIQSITRLTPAMMAGNVSNAMVGLFATYSSKYWPASLIWAAVLILFSGQLFWKHRKSRQREAATTLSPRVINKAIWNSFLLGALWGCLPVLFYFDQSLAGQSLVLPISAGMLCVGAFSLAPLPPAALAFMAPLAATGLITILARNGADASLIVMLTIALAFTLQRAVCAHHDQLVRKVIDRADAEDRARKDALTGLVNRKGFEEFIASNAIEPMKRHGAGFTVMYLDLDDFKMVNDTFGHTAGDELLRRVAERLVNVVRPEDCVARLGGDEFGVICRGIVNPATAGTIAERIVKAFEAPVFIDGRPVYCKTSIGIALAPENGEDAASIIKNADLALYFSKRNKRGDYSFFESEVDERVQRRKQIGQALRHALDRDQFFLEYQPLYSTRSKRISGFEALLRWVHPELGRIGPDEFIPLAEELGLIQDVGEWVIENACQALREWPEHIRASVNFSSIQLRSPTLVDFTLDTLARYEISHERFEIEVTESVSLEGDVHSLAVLEQFRANGIHIALDDFGTGYSSLMYLCTLPISRVKIDRSFVASCFQTGESLSVIQAIIGLAHSLKLQVVAEGIETSAQYHLIAAHGCEEIQGFLLSRPVSREAAEAMAAEPDMVLKAVA